MSKYISHVVKRKQCRFCHTNTDTYTVNHIPYITARGKRKAKKLGEWQNWCMTCIKKKSKELGGR